ncbi:1-deoxy-D-xylulose-5-phosphate reductoisomerase [candidate division WOR-3 bacterium]|nr:1-deoxy-D-xylulose-5-phosphate reductoisomerase [candidate division WOR-3 bacterium]
MDLIVLGATGSIGRQTLEIVEKYPEKYRLAAISANRNIKALAFIARKFKVPKIIITDDTSPGVEILRELKGVKIFMGPDAASEVCKQDDAEMVLNAIVGSAGFLPTKNALLSGKTVALANKETLVAFGEVINEILSKGKGRIIPVDSEHSAVFQLLEGREKSEIESVILTASGGSLRDKSDPSNASIEEVLRHPTWNMGAKITVDSASLVNKGLEVIEASRLFGLEPDRIKVVIHPSSVVHSLVELKDGSLLAQIATPDMKLPIQYALNLLKREDRIIRKIKLHEVSPLEFYEPDYKRFPALSYAYEALKQGGTMPAVFNASNEEAVNLFLKGKINFGRITEIIREAMNSHETQEPCEELIFQAEKWARSKVHELTGEI